VRPLLLWGLPLLVVLLGVLWYGSGGRYATTDNAYIKQDRIDVSPQISGDVREVRAIENSPVQPGQVILALDDTLLQVARMRAEAELATARMNVESLRSAYHEKVGEVAVARQASQYAVSELARQRELAARNLVPKSTLEATQRSRDVAVGMISILELQLNEARSRLGAIRNARSTITPRSGRLRRTWPGPTWTSTTRSSRRRAPAS
jgi:membrane fusion protein (multidrug efflux system)